jgi:hypothetical protein
MACSFDSFADEMRYRRRDWGFKPYKRVSHFNAPDGNCCFSGSNFLMNINLHVEIRTGIKQGAATDMLSKTMPVAGKIKQRPKLEAGMQSGSQIKPQRKEKVQ